MDMIAFFGVFLGVTLAGHGYLWLGSTVLLCPLIALGFALSKVQRPALLFPFSFGSWFVALPLGFLTTFVFRSSIFLGLAIYYYGCIALVERQARYVPWGAGPVSTARRAQRPVVYWLFVSLSFTLSGILLAFALLQAVSSSNMKPANTRLQNDRASQPALLQRGG